MIAALTRYVNIQLPLFSPVLNLLFQQMAILRLHEIFSLFSTVVNFCKWLVVNKLAITLPVPWSVTVGKATFRTLCKINDMC